MANKKTVINKADKGYKAEDVTLYVMELIYEGYTVEEMNIEVNTKFNTDMSFEGIRYHRRKAIKAIQQAKLYHDKFYKNIVVGRIEKLNAKARAKGDIRLQMELAKIYVDMLKSDLFALEKANDTINIVLTSNEAKENANTDGCSE